MQRLTFIQYYLLCFKVKTISVIYLGVIPGDDRAGECSLGFLVSGTSSERSRFNLSRLRLLEKQNNGNILLFTSNVGFSPSTDCPSKLRNITIPVCCILYMRFPTLLRCRNRKFRRCRPRIFFHSYRFI